MTNPIRDFHAHIYYDARTGRWRETDRGRGAAALRGARRALSFRAGRPASARQLPVDRTARAVRRCSRNGWCSIAAPLTIFAHASTGDDLADHTQHVIWFGAERSARPVECSALGVGDPAVDQIVVILGQLAGEVADLEIPRARPTAPASLRPRFRSRNICSKLSSSSGQISRSMHLDPAAPRQVHHRAAGDPVEEAVGGRRVERAVANEEDVGAGRFGHAPAPVEHQGIVEAAVLGMLPRQACRSCTGRPPWMPSARCRARAGATARCPGECRPSDLRGS